MSRVGNGKRVQEPIILAGLEDKYVLLAEILVSELFFAKTLSFIVDQAEYDSLASSLVGVSMEAGNTLSIIREIVSSEFERNFREPGSILRGNCVASKMMGAFSRKVGANYLRECVGDIVSDIVKDENMSLEIDPIKLGDNPDSLVKKNSTLLKQLSNKILDRITSPKYLEKMPIEIKAIAGFTAEYAKIYCPDRLHPLIGGFIMLRLFNPTLVTPDAFGIISEKITLSRKSRRNLTLITKLLQNLSNGVPFGSKEGYMKIMNTFITDNQDKMNEFLTRIVKEAQHTVSNINISNKCAKLSFSTLKAKDLENIHQLFYNYKDKLLKCLSVEVSKRRDYLFEREEVLFQILDELGAPKRKTRIPKGQDNLGIANLTPSDKSGYLMKKHTKGISILADTKRLWVVITSGFLHFFNSPQNTKPLRSISLDELFVNTSSERDNTLGYCFSLTYYRKDHLLYHQHEEEIKKWIEDIKLGKEKYAKMAKIQVNEKLRPIEVRIRNHTMGLKLSYNVSLAPQFDYGKDSRIYFILIVEAFSNSFKLKKTLSDFKELHETLIKIYPKIIFPTFPKKIGEGTTAGMPLGRYNGRASIAVIIMCKFIRSYLHEIKSNLVIQQSEVILNFLELMCPIKAVEHNHISQLSRLLQMSVDFNKHDISGYTALHRAVELDRTEAVRWLSSCSTVHINSKDNNGNSPLLLAIQLNKINLVKILINAGAEVKIKNNIRSSPLHVAAAMGLFEVCKLLLEKGVKIDELNMKRKSPLHYALTSGYPKVAKLLFDNGAKTDYVDSYGNTLLSLATASKLYDIVVYLLTTTNIDVNLQGRFQATALHFAVANGSRKIVSELLKHNANPMIKDIKLNDCLVTSVLYSTYSVIELLCEQYKKTGNLDLEKEYNGDKLLHKAAGILKYSSQIINILVKFGASVNCVDKRKRTPLHIACIKNNIEGVEALLKLNANPCTEDKAKRTPLYIAAYKGNTSICDLLLQHNADPNSIDVDGTSPFHACIWNSKPEIALLFVSNGADINKSEFFQGSSPIQIAIQMKNLRIATILMENDANLNYQRVSDGNTPLHLCIEYDFVVFARILAEIPKVNLSLKNKNGESIISLAVSRNADAALIRHIKKAKEKKEFLVV